MKTFAILKRSVESGRFSSIPDALQESVQLLAGTEAEDFDDDWFSYADERIRAGLADVAAGRTIPAEQFLAELHSRQLKTA